MDIVKEIINQTQVPADLDLTKVSKLFKVKLEQILTALLNECSDIVGAMISSSDGMAWAEQLQQGLDKNRYAAMSSALLALSDSLIKETHKGKVKKVLLEGDSGNLFVMHAGNTLLLTVFTRQQVNIGMSLAHANKAAEEIRSLIDECAR